MSNNETQDTNITTTETPVENNTDFFCNYTGMNEVIKQTRIILNEMNEGEKIGVKELANKVNSKISGMSRSSVTSLVQMYCKTTQDVSIEVGRAGGIYKGGKKRRIDARPRCKECGQVVRDVTKVPDSILTDPKAFEGNSTL